MGVARDTYPGAGMPFSFVAGFAEVEVDVETGHYDLLDYLGVADVGTVLHPRSLGGQILGRSMLGIAPRHRTEVGLRPALRRGAGEAVLPEQAADDPRCAAAHAVGRARTFPIRAPRSARAASASRRSLRAAMPCSTRSSTRWATNVIRRAPVSRDMILTSLEAGRPAYETLTANI